MTYQVIIRNTPQKEIDAIPTPYYNAIKKHIFDLANNPRPVGCKKIVGSVNSYRIRVGVYRIIYTIEDNKLIVEVVKVGHRRDVYN